MIHPHVFLMKISHQAYQHTCSNPTWSRSNPLCCNSLAQGFSTFISINPIIHIRLSSPSFLAISWCQSHRFFETPSRQPLPVRWPRSTWRERDPLAKVAPLVLNGMQVISYIVYIFVCLDILGGICIPITKSVKTVNCETSYTGGWATSLLARSTTQRCPQRAKA